MVLHRNQAQFDRAGWRLVILVPFWMAQITLLLCTMGIFSYRLAETMQNFQENDKKGKFPLVEVVWECTNVGLSVLSLILSFIEIARVASETLTPFAMVFMHVIKFTCAIAILALDIVVYIQRSEGNWSTAGLVIDSGLIAAVLVPGIYSIIIYQRLVKYDDYHHPANVKHFGFKDDRSDLELGNSTEISAQPSSKRASFISIRSNRSRSHSAASMASLHNTDTSYQSQTQGPAGRPLSLAEAGRRESYNHMRDTTFDAYMAERQSQIFKDDVDRAIGAEFGWGSPTADGLGLRPNSIIERSSSVVGSGVVPGARARDSMGRTVSWGSEMALVAVPEEEDHEEERRRQRAGSDGDREALLSGRQRSTSDPAPEEADLGSMDLDTKKRKWAH